MLFQVFFFTRHLTVEQPYASNHIDQKNPIREHQELAQQDKPECHINGIAAKGKDASRYKFVRMVLINANTEALPERNETQEQQKQSCQAQKHSGPGDYCGLKKFLPADGRQIKRSGKHDVKIKTGERRNQEIVFVYCAEMHRFDPFSSHQHDSGPILFQAAAELSGQRSIFARASSFKMSR